MPPRLRSRRSAIRWSSSSTAGRRRRLAALAVALERGAADARATSCFLPNPRGSFGSGEAFTQANVKDFGYGDLRDILKRASTPRSRPRRSTPTRVGIIGWSYGGYMTMWAVTQTDRFRAAVAGAGIANWQSYYGQNQIDTWMIPFFGASVYDDPEVYAKLSPITFIKNVKTPTLVLHGERDSEVPHAAGLRVLARAEDARRADPAGDLPDEGHAIAKPAHQRDIEERLVAWFDRYLMR